MQLPPAGRCLRGLFKIAMLASLLLGARFEASVAAEAEFPGDTWRKADPAQFGWSFGKLEAARKYAEEMESTAVMIVQDGRVIASWGDPRKKVSVHSVRKSFMSALYGPAVAKGQIDLGKTLAELGIDDKPPSLTDREKQATVRDLLMARSGVYHKAAYETKTQKKERPKRGSHKPGAFWFYNNWDFNALGSILRYATSEDTFAAVERHIARPIGMEDFTAADGHYVRDDASAHPAYTMRFTARDLARFGWLYLNGGSWADRQVVPAGWVRESTQPYSPARSGIGYGYLWWVSERDMQFRTRVGPGAFSARGSGGQYIIVAPARRIVVVHLNDLRENSKLDSGEFAELLQRIFAAAPR